MRCYWELKNKLDCDEPSGDMLNENSDIKPKGSCKMSSKNY